MRLFRKRRPFGRDVEVQILRAQPGDVVVITTSAALSYEHARKVITDLGGLVPEGVKVAVMQDGMHVQSVIRPGPQAVFEPVITPI